MKYLKHLENLKYTIMSSLFSVINGKLEIMYNLTISMNINKSRMHILYFVIIVLSTCSPIKTYTVSLLLFQIVVPYKNNN